MLSLFEARAILLREAARLAAERATAEQRRELADLAAAVSAATDDDVRQTTDFAFMAALIEASGNLVFRLIVNSMRASYLAQRADYRAMVPAGLGARYQGIATAVAESLPDEAATAMDQLTAAQLKLLLEAAQ
jgi:DNA-binding FadR family transcriptional regulator